MNYLDKYVSNTLAGSSNQLYFTSQESLRLTGRAFYKIHKAGEFEYSFLFSDTIDSTYADGSISHVNETSGAWTIHSLSAIITKEIDFKNEKKYKLYFDGKEEKKVEKGELFNTDPITLSIKKDEYLCLEIEFSGTKIPYFEEINIPTSRLENGVFVPSKKTVVPSMIGINCHVEKRVCFLGDSITQGIGTRNDSYEHWNAKIAELVGEKYSFWNLGIGFGRVADVATDGVWLSKAKKMDACTVCFGVNDLGRGYTTDEIKSNIKKVVEILQVHHLIITKKPRKNGRK